MASIHKEVLVDASIEEVCGAIRDVGGIHTRLARQFVVDTRLDGESRRLDRRPAARGSGGPRRWHDGPRVRGDETDIGGRQWRR